MKMPLRLIYGLLAIYLTYKHYNISHSSIYVILGIFIVMTVTRKSIGKSFKKQLNFESIDKMDGFDFERLIANLYTKLGYSAYKTPDSGDYGADVIAKRDKDKIAIQCKRYSSLVGITAVQEVIGSMKYYKATKGAVITNNYFTAAAKKLAIANNIELIDRGKLRGLIYKCK